MHVVPTSIPLLVFKHAAVNAKAGCDSAVSLERVCLSGSKECVALQRHESVFVILKLQ